MSIERELLKDWTDTTYQEPEVQLAAGPTDTMTDTGPAFTMPGMGKRSQKSEIGQNLPLFAADAAAGAGKGLVSGVLGFAGDIESLYQGVKGIINRGGDETALQGFLRGMADKTIAPTSDEVSKWLDANVGPVVPKDSGMSPEMQKARESAAGAGEFAGQLSADPMVIIRGGKVVAQSAKALIPKAAEMAINVTEKTGVPVRGLGVVEGQPNRLILSDLTKTLFKEQEKDASYIRLKNPVTLKDGARLSGFNDPATQNVFIGYDKNGELFTVRREYINPEDVVSSRDSNKTANLVREGLKYVKAGESK
jgi:hypothetical protein